MKYCALFFLFISCSVFAEETLTWQDCVNESLAKNPDLLTALEKVNQAGADEKITFSALLPQIETSAGINVSKQKASNTQDNYSYDIGARQLVFDGGKTKYDVDNRRENVKAVQYDYDVTSSNVRLSLRSAFAQLLRAQELVGVTDDIRQRRRQNYQLVHLRYEAGIEHKGSLLAVQAELVKSEYDVRKAARDTYLSQQRLIRYLGRDEYSDIKASGNFETIYSVYAKPNFEYIMENNPLIQEVAAKKEAAKFGLKSSQADLMPAVYASASAGGNGGNDNSGYQLSAGLDLSFSLYEGGRKNAQIEKSRSQVAQAEADLRSGKEGVIYTLAQTWTAYKNAVENVYVQKTFYVATKVRAKISRAQYAAGLLSFDNWIIIENDLVNAEENYLDAEALMLIAEAEWIQAIGGTLEYEKNS